MSEENDEGIVESEEEDSESTHAKLSAAGKKGAAARSARAKKEVILAWVGYVNYFNMIMITRYRNLVRRMETINRKRRLVQRKTLTLHRPRKLAFLRVLQWSIGRLTF